MAFKPGMHENILFPVPYAENEQHPLIITNKRVVQRSDAGEVEMATDDIHFVGRHTVRPRMPLGVMLLVFALPLLGFGIYKFYDVWGYTAASPLSLVSSSADDSATQVPTDAPADGDEATPESGPKEVLVARVVGGLCLLLALGCAIGARALIRKKRFYVTAKGNKRLLKMEVKDEIQQTQVMVTVSAVKGKAKAS